MSMKELQEIVDDLNYVSDEAKAMLLEVVQAVYIKGYNYAVEEATRNAGLKAQSKTRKLFTEYENF